MIGGSDPVEARVGGQSMNTLRTRGNTDLSAETSTTGDS